MKCEKKKKIALVELHKKKKDKDDFGEKKKKSERNEKWCKIGRRRRIFGILKCLERGCEEKQKEAPPN